MSQKTIMFIPSNENQCHIFQSISTHLKNSSFVFLSQGSYKDEGAEKTLAKLGIDFRRIDDYEKKDPDFILKKENVGVVVIGNDSDVIPQWFVNVGKNLGIPSVFVQDGMMVDIKTMGRNLVKSTKDKITQTSPKLKLLALQLGRQKLYKKTTYGLGGCAQIHTWGRQSESYYVNKGVSRETILITGIPKIYDSGTLSNENREKTVLYTPTDFVRMNIVKPDLAKKLADDVCSVAISLGLRLIIKPHPREDPKLYKNLPEKFGPNISVSTEDVTRLLPVSNMVISDLSTVGLEAIGQKMPVVIYLPNIDLFTAPDLFPNDAISKGLALHAGDKQSLYDQVTKILGGRWIPKYENLNVIENYLGPLDNNGTVRSAKYIMDLLHSK